MVRPTQISIACTTRGTRSILSLGKLVFYSETITAVSLGLCLSPRAERARTYWISASYEVLGSSEKRKIFSTTRAATVISRQGDVRKPNTYFLPLYKFTFLLLFTTPLPLS